ncbi:hypothetical protein C5S29_06830 [ANME-1 cluster archaeon GoMg3.2]|nr:hypothetical protein [ANME-1 cluster archaeon GoMg3.2]
MEKIARLISVVAIVMALMIAFSGVAAASWLTEYTPEKQTVNTLMGYDRTEIGDQGFDFWKSSSTSKFGSFEGMNAYSRLLATDVQATTRVEVGMTNNPILNYEIDAEGSNGWSTGRISAGMSVYVAGDSDGGLGSILSYEERSSASGLFQFHKAMSYTSKVTTP